jgi:hypothetical protein
VYAAGFTRAFGLGEVHAYVTFQRQQGKKEYESDGNEEEDVNMRRHFRHILYVTRPGMNYSPLCSHFSPSQP